MNKDLKATLIFLLVLSIPTSAYLFGEYASRELKQNMMLSIIILMSVGILFAIWKLIRHTID